MQHRQKGFCLFINSLYKKFVIIILIHLLTKKDPPVPAGGSITITTSPVMWLASMLQGADYLGESWGEKRKLIPYPALSIVSVIRLSTELLKRGKLIVPFCLNFLHKVFSFYSLLNVIMIGLSD